MPITKIQLNIVEQIDKEKKLLDEIIEWNTYDNLNNYEEILFEDFIKKSLEKEMLKVFFDNLLYFSKKLSIMGINSYFLIKINQLGKNLP